MNTTVWLISFTDRGEKVQKAHTHNCVADYRLIDPAATVQEIDCAAVAELINKAENAATAMSNIIAAGQVDSGYSGIVTDLTSALAAIGSMP